MSSQADPRHHLTTGLPNRRAVIGAGLAAGAVGWIAPSIISSPAAAAATAAPGPVIDPFTFPASASGLGGQVTTTIDPFLGVAVTRMITTNTAASSLTVASGQATFVATGPGAVTLHYQFAAPLDLVAFTQVEAACSFTGTLDDLYVVVGTPGSAELALRFAEQPVARFDLTAIGSDTLSQVTSMDLVISAISPLTIVLGSIRLA